MKKYVVLLVFTAGVFFYREAFALDLAGGKTADITVTEAYASRYISKGQDAFPDNDSAYHPSIDITFPRLMMDTDISFNAWGAFALSAGHEEYDEMDYSISLSRDIFKYWNAVLGYAYFDYPKANKLVDTNDPWIALTLKKIPGLPIDVSAKISAIYEFPAASGGPENGFYYSWGFETKLPLPDITVFQKDQFLSLGVINWGTDGVGGRKPARLYATVFSAGTEYTFGKLAFSPGVHYAANYEDAINEGKGEFWGEFDVIWKF
jgi:hypothetical protein